MASEDTVAILNAQLPLLNRLRKSTMLAIALRATVSREQLLGYIVQVNANIEGLIQLNERTIISQGGKIDDYTATSSSDETAAGETTGEENIQEGGNPSEHRA